MTQEEKQLLLQDISARLPYGVMATGLYEEYDDNDELIKIKAEAIITVVTKDYITIGFNSECELKTVRPYLRPMSSMADEEKEEIENIEKKYFGEALDKQIQECLSSSPKDESRKLEYFASSKIIDYLNKHHFDYRGLIEKGLALEALENMYNTKTDMGR